MQATDFSGKARPTPSWVRSLRPMGWADFKHKLVRSGVIASPTDDVPEAYKQAFCECFGRTHPTRLKGF